MKFKARINGFTIRVKNGIYRFFGTFLITLLFFGLLTYRELIHNQAELIRDLFYTLGMGLFSSVIIVLLFEFKNKMNLWVHLFSLFPLLCTYTACRNGNPESAYFTMGYFGIILAIICFSLCLLFSEKNSVTLIAHLVRSIAFTISVCVILMLSLFVCIWAIDTLIISLKGEVYTITAYFIWSVLFINLFLTYVPKKNDDIELPKLFKVLTLYVGLPVYLLLLLILVAYLLKIVITWKMPVGQINWFASFASLFFVFFSFAVRPFENKFTKIFQRGIGFVILPIILVQLIAIYERVVAYGFTTPRTVSLILVGVSVIYAVFSIIRKRTDYIFAVVGGVILIFTLIPNINIIDIPKNSQLTILEETLIKNDMLVDGEIIPKVDIPEEDKERIDGAYRYLKIEAEEPLPELIEKNKNRKFSEIFGFNSHTDYWQTREHLYYKAEDTVSIEGYRLMYNNITVYVTPEMMENKILKINDREFSFDISEYCKHIYSTYKEDEEIPEIKINDNIAIIPDPISFTYNIINDSIENVDIRGYMLEK